MYINSDVLNDDEQQPFQYKFTVESSKIKEVFSYLYSLFKGRDTERVFSISFENNILRLEAMASIYFSYILDITELESQPSFKAVYVYHDITSNIDEGITTIDITHQYISFKTPNSSITLSSSFSVVNSFVPLIQTIEFQKTDTESMIYCFKRLKALRTLTKDFPTNQNIHCFKKYAYIITPVMCAYINGCPITSTIDIRTADFLIDISSGKKVDMMLGYTSDYFCIKYKNADLLIPRVDYQSSVSDSPLNIETEDICKITVKYLYDILSKLKMNEIVTLSFLKDSLLIDLEMSTFKFSTKIAIKSSKEITIQTNANYLFASLSLFNLEDIITVKVGERLLCLQSIKERVYLSCLS